MTDRIGTRTIALIGLPYHFGERPRSTGYQMALGPSVLLGPDGVPAGLDHPTTLTWIDDADDPTPTDLDAAGHPLPVGDQMARQLVQCRRVSAAVQDAVSAGSFPLVVAGNCHTSLGVLAGIADPDAGVIWFDAHADAESTDTSSLGMFEGMPVSVLAGRSWPEYARGLPGLHVVPEDRIITVGDHAVDHPDPNVAVDGGAIGRWVNPAVLPGDAFERELVRAVADLATRVSRVHVHIDPDVIDERIARSSRHSAPLGLSPEQLIRAIEVVADALEITSITVAAYDPAVDPRSAEVFAPMIATVVSTAAS